MRVGGKGLHRIDQETPLSDGSRPASPGAPFILSMACVAARPWRRVGHDLFLGAPAVRGEGQRRGRFLGTVA